MNEIKTSSIEKRNEYITSDRMVLNILVSSVVGLVVIALAVGLVGNNPLVLWALFISIVINLFGIILASRGNAL